MVHLYPWCTATEFGNNCWRCPRSRSYLCMIILAKSRSRSTLFEVFLLTISLTVSTSFLLSQDLVVLYGSFPRRRYHPILDRRSFLRLRAYDRRHNKRNLSLASSTSIWNLASILFSNLFLIQVSRPLVIQLRILHRRLKELLYNYRHSLSAWFPYNWDLWLNMAR